MKKITILICSLFLICSNILFAQHFKKNGTPDMRFKENKSSYSTSPSGYSTSSSTSNYNTNSTTHFKKDGTPDKRYKKNKTFILPAIPLPLVFQSFLKILNIHS